MAKPAAVAVPLAKLELYEKLVATNPRVERKGATVPYTSLNGHMFSYLTKEGKLALRLPAAQREVLLKKYKARLCDAYGKVQPEYVEVPDSLLSSTGELKKFFDCSYEYVASLKPKPPAKTKKVRPRSTADRKFAAAATPPWGRPSSSVVCPTPSVTQLQDFYPLHSTAFNSPTRSIPPIAVVVQRWGML